MQLTSQACLHIHFVLILVEYCTRYRRGGCNFVDNMLTEVTANTGLYNAHKVYKYVNA